MQWANDLTDEMLAGELRYTSVVNPEPRSYEMWLAVTHFSITRRIIAGS